MPGSSEAGPERVLAQEVHLRGIRRPPQGTGLTLGEAGRVSERERERAEAFLQCLESIGDGQPATFVRLLSLLGAFCLSGTGRDMKWRAIQCSLTSFRFDFELLDF